MNQDKEICQLLKECRERVGKIRAHNINYETHRITNALSLSDKLEALIFDLCGDVPIHDFKTGKYKWKKP